jgi:predicted O-methyltransferase YrrM
MTTHEDWRKRSRDYLNRVCAEAPKHASEWKLFEALDCAVAPYRPIHAVPDDGISEYNRRLAAAKGGMHGSPFLIDIGIEGFLHKEEALKLYEMAYYASGDILELGTHKGLSTSILVQALHDRGNGEIVTIDINKATNKVAMANLARSPGAKRVNFMLTDAKAGMDKLTAEGRIFAFVFVDHWHGYEATYDAALRVYGLLSAGRHVMFHDFFDPSNADPEHVYGVYQAVIDVFGTDPRFIFAGAAGSSALFVKATRAQLIR